MMLRGTSKPCPSSPASPSGVVVSARGGRMASPSPSPSSSLLLSLSLSSPLQSQSPPPSSCSNPSIYRPSFSTLVLWLTTVLMALSAIRAIAYISSPGGYGGAGGIRVRGRGGGAERVTGAEESAPPFPRAARYGGWIRYIDGGVDIDVDDDNDAGGADDAAATKSLVKEQTEEESREKRREIVVWSNDFHISTIGNIKSLLLPSNEDGGDKYSINLRFIDKSLSGHCHLTNTCATNLRVLDRNNGISPDESTRERFVREYKNDAEMQSVDVVMCFHPSAMCELFMPLIGKRLFVVATTRYEMGRHKPDEWATWNDNLLKIASDDRNLIAANNLYDAKYVEYFTGISPALMPSWTDMADVYAGNSSGNGKSIMSTDVLVAEMHAPDNSKNKLMSILADISPRFVPLRQKYPRFTFAQLCQNTAILHLPYQVSIMSLFEQYGMGVPILVPSAPFLWSLHDTYGIVSERTWEQVNTGGRRPRGSVIPGVVVDNGSGKDESVPDPNNDIDKDAFLYWVQYADFYQWPHIVQFDSWDHLGLILDDTDWNDVSGKMRTYYREALSKTRDDWMSKLSQ